MASLCKNLRLLSNIVRTTNTVQRTLFAPASLAIDRFKKQQENVELLNINNIATFKKRIEDSLIEGKNVFTEDLKTLLFLTRDDKDVELLQKALKKYAKQDLSISEYVFGPQLMRLFYIQDKPDIAIKMFQDPELVKIFSDGLSLLILMNKLNELKRYSDTIQLFEKAINEPSLIDSKTGKLIVSNDSFKIVFEALYYLNNKQAIDKLKEYFKLLKKYERTASRMSVANSILLALNQNENELAYELLTNLKTSNDSFCLNLQAIIFAKMQRLKECFDSVERIINMQSPPDSKQINNIFPLTMKTIRQEVEKKNDKELIDRLENLSKLVIAQNKLNKIDITDITLKVVQVRQTLKGPVGINRQNIRSNDNQDLRSGRSQDSQRQFGGQPSYERRQFGNRLPQDGERRPFSQQGQQNVGGFNQQNRQQGQQNVGGFSPQSRQQGQRFDQGSQSLGNPNQPLRQRTAPPSMQTQRQPQKATNNDFDD